MSLEKKLLKKYWKPDGKTISKSNQDHLRQWMRSHGFSTQPGAITVLIPSLVHESARTHALRAMKIRHK